jgi:hypothetical protein
VTSRGRGKTVQTIQMNGLIPVPRYVDSRGRVCVTLKGAARLLGVNDASVRWLIASGQLSSTRRQVGRERWPRHLIPLDAVRRVKREREDRAAKAWDSVRGRR